MGAMPTSGTNLEDDSQMMDTTNALWIENYLVHGRAKMQKRPGQIENFDVGDGNTIPFEEEFLYNYDIIPSGTTVRAYDNVNDSFTTIKSDFTSSAYTGGRYGDYFFINTPLDGLWRIYFQFTWSEYYDLSGTNIFIVSANAGSSISPSDVLTDTGTGNTGTVSAVTALSATSFQLTITGLSGSFTLGGAVTGGSLSNASLSNVNPFTTDSKITGATSSAEAIMLEQTDNGATGSFVLGSINGTFTGSEVITDQSTGKALMTSVVAFAITQVTDAPLADVFKIMGKRSVLIGLGTNKAAGAYSNRDDGSSPVFTGWTDGTTANSAGTFANRHGGACTDAALVDDIFFIGQQKGWFAFRITTFSDADGNVLKRDEEVATRRNFPIYKCEMTNVGMIVLSDSGVSRMISLGQRDVPYSDQWERLTSDLGEDYFADVSFANGDIMYDPSRGFIYATMAKDSQVNNLVLATKVDLPGTKNKVKKGATSFLTGWNVLNFMVRGRVIYGTSAINGVRHQLFIGQKDVQNTIHTEYLQEINFSFTDAFNLEEFITKIELSGASLIKISFDTFDETGLYEPRRRTYNFSPRHDYTDDSAHWGESGFGRAGWGGGGSSSGLIPTKRGRLVKLRQLSRVYVRYESDDASEHIINWFSAKAFATKTIRDNSLDIVTN